MSKEDSWGDVWTARSDIVHHYFFVLQSPIFRVNQSCKTTPHFLNLRFRAPTRPAINTTGNKYTPKSDSAPRSIWRIAVMFCMTRNRRCQPAAERCRLAGTRVPIRAFPRPHPPAWPQPLQKTSWNGSFGPLAVKRRLTKRKRKQVFATVRQLNPQIIGIKLCFSQQQTSMCTP